YRAEAERTEVFAPLVPVERVWVEEYGFPGTPLAQGDIRSRLVSLDEPPRKVPVPAADADSLSGRRIVEMLEDGGERRDLRAVTEAYTNDDGDISARVATELEWYR